MKQAMMSAEPKMALERWKLGFFNFRVLPANSTLYGRCQERCFHSFIIALQIHWTVCFSLLLSFHSNPIQQAFPEDSVQ